MADRRGSRDSLRLQRDSLRLPRDGLRLLQVVADSDATHENLAALALHRSLDATGIEVRTLALAPGRVGGLASEVPTMSPSGRSLAAHTQLRREQRWADVVLLRGAEPAAAAGVSRISGAPPTVLALSSEPRRWRTEPVPSRVLRTARGLERLVVCDPSDTDVADRLGLPVESAVAIPFGADTSPVISDARRRAARDRLGLSADEVVVHLVADDRITDADVGRAIGDVEAVGARCTTTPRPDGRTVRFGVSRRDELDALAEAAELALAAADLVTVVRADADSPDDPFVGPPPGLVRAMAAGLAPVGPDSLLALLDRSQGRPTGWSSLGDAVRSSPAEVRRRGVAAAAAVRDLLALDVVTRTWCELLATTASAGPAAGPST